jgi:hypothetical protein
MNAQQDCARRAAGQVFKVRAKRFGSRSAVEVATRARSRRDLHDRSAAAIQARAIGVRSPDAACVQRNCRVGGKQRAFELA